MRGSGVVKKLKERVLYKLSRLKKVRPIDVYDWVVFAFVRSYRYVRKFYNFDFKEFKRRSLKQNTVFVGLNVVFALFVALTILVSLFMAPKSIRLSEQAEALLPEQKSSLNSYIAYEPETSSYEYNESYTADQGDGLSSSSYGIPRIKASIKSDTSGVVSVTDPYTSQTVSLIPNFEINEGARDGNRILYDIENVDGHLVYTTATIGIKEDIILNSHPSDNIEFSYQLDTPEGLEARLESDGSIGIYGVNPALLGDVAAETEDDQQLLEDARKNGEKNQIIFTIPAPFIVETGKSHTNTQSHFDLDGDIITLKSSGLKDANYPLTIDPSIYVETAAKLMRGNNETNIDFDVSNELIQKAFTTGARIDTWDSTMALNESRFDGGTAVAGGYVKLPRSSVSVSNNNNWIGSCGCIRRKCTGDLSKASGN